MNTSFSQNVGGISDFIKNKFNTVRNSLSQVSARAYEETDKYLPTSMSSGGFFDSNSVVTKFAFLITVVIIFAISINIGVSFIGYLSTPSSNPYIVKGMISGSQAVSLSQNPKDSTAVSILRSSDQPAGLEFTWSVWLLIDSSNFTTTSDEGKMLHVFNKGNATYSSLGLATLSNAPGLYITHNTDSTTTGASTTAKLRVYVDTVDSNTITSDISSIPLDKWFHVAIRAENNVIDVYINGTISQRTALDAVPMQNYYNVNVCQNSGFSGKLSNLRYFSRALSAYDINSVVSTGPSLVSATNSLDARTSAYYLSDSWFTARRDNV